MRKIVLAALAALSLGGIVVESISAAQAQSGWSRQTRCHWEYRDWVCN